MVIHLVECRPIKYLISDSQEVSFEERCSALAHNAFSWFFCLCYNIPLLSSVFELQAVDLVYLVPLCVLLFLLFTVQL